MTDPTKTTNQFLAFALGAEEFCVPIMAVREINNWVPATRLPNTPVYMRGVINLRGSIVPIFDLRARFRGELTEADKSHVVIILAVGERTFGLLVDTVSDILTVDESAMRPAPSEKVTLGRDFVNGLLMVEDSIVTVLNVENLFDLSVIEAAQKQVA